MFDSTDSKYSYSYSTDGRSIFKHTIYDGIYEWTPPVEIPDSEVLLLPNKYKCPDEVMSVIKEVKRRESLKHLLDD